MYFCAWGGRPKGPEKKEMPGVKTFDNNVAAYEDWFEKNAYAYQSELMAIRELMPSGKGVEIGAGTGLFAAPLKVRYGVEPSRAMRGRARERGVIVINGTAEALPFGHAEFDFCLMVTTVCFLDDIARAFSEAHRVLKPGGAFIIGFVDRDSPLGKEYLRRKDESVFYKDATFYSADDVVRHMKQAGFGDFAFRQTIFQSPGEMREAGPVKEGRGEGSFVVVRGVKAA